MGGGGANTNIRFAQQDFELMQFKAADTDGNGLDDFAEIQQGQFAKEWVLENQANRPVYNALLAKGEAHPIEAVGAKLRAMMPWLKKDQLVDKNKN